jgi:hypothetical protein
MTFQTQLIIAAVVLAVIFFVPVVRRIVSTVIGISIAVASIAVAIAGGAMLLNDVSIYGPPGTSARIWRFLTMNSAATSEKGSSSAQCPQAWEGAQAPPPASAPPEATGKQSKARKPPPETQAAGGAGTPGGEAEEEDFPELVRHGYPGIARARLFQLAQQTVAELGGWKTVGSDPRRFTLDCLYITRVFRMEDDVRIIVTPNSEIDLCSRSRTGAPDSTSWLSFFPGDFGANIGHIKEFYQALEPKVDAVYKEQESKQK